MRSGDVSQSPWGDDSLANGPVILTTVSVIRPWGGGRHHDLLQALLGPGWRQPAKSPTSVSVTARKMSVVSSSIFVLP